ncbi:tRNA-guanine transglycosylase [Colletotrichum graminicola]|uniref:Queuine tRNA-ribosyltransferase accessory subunit 2 n=1 Tax=Colletotrichum graminicola (strain M1.001 / M2 / FGSC 10212) TaxID=645133 RepID=E3QG47_COLGM|nr:tRNA-guanine transglycosylase [Colletotrichum graminicola M1.001]EFQ29882.1 tRNA-guanine transglycosylase [Colletotrichum graminicola M1.001]WDK12289.1 tRNA-guanine transglycosylase [Colletotrichum graminicola]
MSNAETFNVERNSEGMIFEILKKAANGSSAARLGRLSLPKRNPIETPNYIAVASRGVVPHVTPDNLEKYTSISAVYMALEDFIEKKNPSVLSIPSPDKKPLHTFACLPDGVATVLAPRRCPAIKTPVGNGAKFMAIFTSTGFRNLTTDEYSAAVETLKPDIAIGPADLFHTSTMPVPKKLARMAERTEEWTNAFLTPKRREAFEESGVSVFAPVLAVPHPIQWEHLRHLAEDVIDSISGLAIYDVDLLPDMEDSYEPLVSLPRLSLHIPSTPQAILRQISLGVDVCTIPFMNTISDAGVALSFTFPPPSTQSNAILPLGDDMWSPENETSLKPLVEGCQCYACTTHHRAFLHHLLNAKEMLGWTLLQIHNHHTMKEFFTGIRTTLAEEPFAEKFEEQAERFAAVYEAELPQGTGTRPRARGYHFKPDPNPSRINPPAWERFSAGGEAVANGVAGAAVAPEGTETPLVPDVGSLKLEEKGFAEVAHDKQKPEP